MKRLTFTSGSASNERGQILVLTAVLLTAILGIAALSLDAAFMYDERNRLFAAADAAAKAAALEMRRSGAANLQTFANHEVAVHGFNPAAAGTSVQVNHPPASGPFAGDTDYVETIVSRQTSTFFGRLLGAANLTPGARAVAGGSPHPDCIIALNSMTLSISGARLDAVNCGIWVGDGGLANSGSISSSDVSVSGSCSGNCSGVTVGASPPTDPLSGLNPPAPPGGATCSAPLSVSSNTMMSVTDVNEYYCGLTFSGGSLTLNPGIYYVAGPITVTSAGIDVLMTGSHVMIYLSPTASLDLETNHLDMTLSAPASGDYKGIIFYQDRANSTTAVLGKNDGTLTLDGALYFPSATLTMKNENSGSTTNPCTLIVAGSINMDKPSLDMSRSCSDFGGSPLRTTALAE